MQLQEVTQAATGPFLITCAVVVLGYVAYLFGLWIVTRGAEPKDRPEIIEKYGGFPRLLGRWTRRGPQP